MSINKVAIIGSAFNPPTLGHKNVIEQVLASPLGFKQVMLIPSYQHAFGKEMADYEHRCQMLELFVQDINEPKVTALCIEPQVQQSPNQPVFTYDVLAYIEQHITQHSELYFVIGPDNLANWNKFYKAEEVTQRWSLFCAEEQHQIRSTLVRNALTTNQPTEQWLTPRVQAFLTQHQLYG